MKKSILFLGALAIAAIAVGVYKYGPWPQPNPDPNHTHADFAVWMDGEEFDYSDERLMSGSSTDAQHAEEGNKKYLHLHDGNGRLIHRHKPGLTLDDFFDTLQVGFLGNCYASFAPLEDGEICSEHPWRLFVNGKEKIPFDLSYEFQDLDRILLTTSVDPVEIAKQLSALTDDACRYSQTCPWKGKPPTENCIADPEVPCVAQ